MNYEDRLFTINMNVSGSGRGEKHIRQYEMTRRKQKK